MGKILLDTDVLIYILEKADKSFLEKIIREYDFYISVITYFEFLVGAYRTNKLFLKDLLENNFFIIPITEEIADKGAKMQAKLMEKGTPIDPRDIVIGATAIVERMPLCTFNLKHFSKLKTFGLQTIDIRNL